MKKTLWICWMIVNCFWVYSQNITIDASKEFQTMEGMGGYGPFSGTYTERHFKQVMDNLGCTMIRMDLPDDYVTSLANLNAGILNNGTTSTFGKKMDFIYKAKAKGDVKVIVTVWSPPAWMKKNNNVLCQCCLDGKPFSCDTSNYLLPSQYSNFAKYLGLFAKDYKQKTGSYPYAISLQNEPMFNEPYPSALLYALPYANLLKVVGPYFAADPELAGIKFFGPEHMCQYGGNAGGSNGYLVGNEASRYIQYLLDDADVRKYLHAYAVHGYVGGITIDPGTSNDWTAFSAKTTLYNKQLWMTETGIGKTWGEIFGTAKGIFLGLKYGKVSGWTFWVLADNLMSNDIADSRTAVCKQYFRFIRPGYKQIEANDGVTGVATVAFKNGSDMTLVVINEGTTEKTLTLTAAAGTTLPPSFQVYRTSETEYCSYLGKISDYNVKFPAKSVTTLYNKASEPNVIWAPNAPKNVQAISITENSGKITWSAADAWTLNATPASYSPAYTGYYVYRKNTDGSWTRITDGSITATSLNLTSLKPGLTYTYGVSCIDNLYNISAKTEITFKTPCTTNCPDTTNQTFLALVNDSISVYPNPANGIVNVTGTEDAIIQVYDIMGKLVAAQKSTDAVSTLDLSAETDGTYMIKIIKRNYVINRKVQILK